jgi:hypothetical protein
MDSEVVVIPYYMLNRGIPKALISIRALRCRRTTTCVDCACSLFVNRPVRSRMPWWCGRGGFKARLDPLRRQQAAAVVAGHSE